MSVLRVFLTADSEFAIENLPKPKGNPEINAREKRTLFSRFFAVYPCIIAISEFNLITIMCGIKNPTTYIGVVNFEDNLLGKSAKKHEKKYVIVSFARYNPEPGFFKCQIWIPRRKTLRVGPVTKHSGTVKDKSQLAPHYSDKGCEL